MAESLLPELWKQIMLSNSVVYAALVSTCKDMAKYLFPLTRDDIARMFTVYREVENNLRVPAPLGCTKIFAWVLPNGFLHSPDDYTPAYTSDIVSRYYYFNMLHRFGDKPAIIYHDGANRVVEWLSNLASINKYLAAEDTEAIFRPLLELQASAVIYYKYGLVHRHGDLPAIVDIISQDNLQIQVVYYKCDKKHRVGGPAQYMHSHRFDYYSYDQLRYSSNIEAFASQ